MAEQRYQIGFGHGPIAGRLVFSARLDSVFRDSITDFRQGGMLNMAEGLAKRFHIHNFELIRLPGQ